MPRFHFHLRACGALHRDLAGTDCLDLTQARAHAVAVAQELMDRSEQGYRHWSMRVEDANGEPVFDLFLADVAARRELLPVDMHELIALTCRRHAELIDVLCAVRATIAESRMLRARSTRKPQLVFGRTGARP